MKIEILNRRLDHEHNRKFKKQYIKMEELIEALNKKGIPEDNAVVINADIKMINSFSGTEKDLTLLIKKTYSKVLAFIEKELKLVKKFHYQNKWMGFGMLAGVLFSTIFSNLVDSATWTSMGMGISMGLLFGLLAGKNRDNSADKEGLQLGI